MLKAFLFDFDGVVVNSEPVHFEVFRLILEEQGIALTHEEYAAVYLAMDDRECFATALSGAGRPSTAQRVRELMARQSVYFAARRDQVPVLPGSVTFVRRAAARYATAIGSLGPRSSIDFFLTKLGLRDCFPVIVSAEDCERGKPDPECFRTCLARLNRNRPSPILPEECLVVEDSLYGIAAAHAAGMRCLAVASSYSLEQLAAADRAVGTLDGICPDELEAMFSTKGNTGP